MRLGELPLPNPGEGPGEERPQRNDKEHHPQGVADKSRGDEQSQGDEEHQGLSVEEGGHVAEAYVPSYATQFGVNARAHDSQSPEGGGPFQGKGEIEPKTPGNLNQEVAVGEAKEREEKQHRDQAGKKPSVEEPVYSHNGRLP